MMLKSLSRIELEEGYSNLDGLAARNNNSSLTDTLNLDESNLQIIGNDESRPPQTYRKI